MKCEYCKGTLSLEDEYCPHCGRPNAHAKKHIEDMRYYDSVYEETKGNVYAATKKYAGITVQVVIIAVMLILAVVFCVIGANAYSIRRNMAQTRAEQKAEEYQKQMDEYLENHQFREFYAFCIRNNIDEWSETYQEYRVICSAARTYDYFCQYLISYYSQCSEEQDSGEDYSYLIEEIGNQIKQFYGCKEDSIGSYYRDIIDVEKTNQVLNDMEQDIWKLMRTYCSFTQEEVENLETMSTSKICVIIEERKEIE